jgi:hypothetical protein
MEALKVVKRGVKRAPPLSCDTVHPIGFAVKWQPVPSLCLEMLDSQKLRGIGTVAMSRVAERCTDVRSKSRNPPS